VPSTRQRELARQRAQRQAARYAQRRKRRQRTIAIVGGLSVLLVAGTLGLVAGLTNSSGTSSGNPSGTSSNKAGPAVACNGPVPASSAPKTYPSAPPMTINTNAAYTMTLNTSCGTIGIALEAGKAPQTVNSMNFLAAQGYFNGSPCHRLERDPGATILQCGDPTGTGSGTPGYRLAQENLKGAKYTRGTMAMANSGGANSTGSQFFLVDQDSSYPPDYTIVGHITGPAGLDVLDKLMAVGDDGTNQAGGGAPLQRIYLNTVTVSPG
jgi:peptidyl-prolyl cis-trans isomerase B (cyclophilin B)